MPESFFNKLLLLCLGDKLVYLSVNTELVELKNYGMTEFIGVMIELMELNNESSELLKFLDTRLIRVEVNLINCFCRKGIYELVVMLIYQLSSRSSHRRSFVKKSVLKNFTKFTGKHLRQSHFLNKVAGLRPARDSGTGVFL